MTRKLSLTTAVAAAALSVGAPAAFGVDRLPVSQEPVLAQPNPMIEDAFGRAVAAKSAESATVPRYSDSADAATVATQSELAIVPRYSDSADGATFGSSTETPVVSATSAGTEIEWPQVGVGLGIGILLALGLGLIMRMVHIRPFAHR